MNPNIKTRPSKNASEFVMRWRHLKSDLETKKAALARPWTHRRTLTRTAFLRSVPDKNSRIVQFQSLIKINEKEKKKKQEINKGKMERPCHLEEVWNQRMRSWGAAARIFWPRSRPMTQKWLFSRGGRWMSGQEGERWGKLKVAV